MNTMTYEEAYDLYRKMWEKKLAKGNRSDPSAPSSSEPAIKAGSAALISLLIFGKITLIMMIFQKMKGDKEDGIPFLQL